MIRKYLNYLNSTESNNADNEIRTWIETVLAAYLRKSQQQEDQTEIEHIIDYLRSDEAPKRLRKMSYEQAKTGSEKWVNSLKKKGAEINEKPEDVEVVLDFEDGFKAVKLVGENAFKREGFLMSHCVGSYAGRKDTEIYSLRDSKNMPHATIEWGNQIKGKGNGSIHPKYVDYVVRFLEYKKMPMRDSEMMNLGYLQVDPTIKSWIVQKFPKASFYKDNFVFVESVKENEKA